MMRQFLIIDADDTLWENNIYFEQAFDDFVEFLAHSHLTPPQIRDVLDEIEAVNAKIHGYGSLNFGRNLRQTYQHLAEREVNEKDLNTVMGFAERILECPMQVIDGVAGDAGVPDRAARPHAVHQRPSGGAEAEDRPLRPGKVFRPPGHREGERRCGLREPGSRARHGPVEHLDDWQ